ncbi:MAG TPA: PEGA domain-containing protein [Polyangia bacterium]
MGELSAPVVVLRVTVRAPDLDAFITRYSRHLAGDRIFIFSKAPQPVGTHVRFNLQLTSGEVLLQGRGTVKRVQDDGGDARHPPGMEVQFKPLDERSATLVDFMMATRAGLTESIVAKAAPVARAVVPAKPPSLPPRPTPLTPLPKLSAQPTPPSPIPLPPPPPKPTPGKPTPVARPPSLSLESVWKSEAGEAATDAASTFVDKPFAPVAAVDSAPLGDIVAAAVAEAAAATHEPAPPPSPSKPHELGTIIPPTADPSVNAPPVFAESWGGDAPANPFSDVSDGAIEYFVEWSIEQSIGPRARPQARFSDVPMALPGDTGAHGIFDPRSRGQKLALFGGLFAAGLLVGGVVVGLAMRHSPSSRSSPPLAAAITPAPVATPAAPAPSATSATSSGDAELVVTTRPPGAAVTIDGAAAGATPLQTHVAAGHHEVAVSKERYAATTTTTDAPGKLTLDLRRPPATLHVTSTPPAADVVIAGEHRGKTPVDIRLPGFESYEIRVSLAGARPWHKTVYLSHASNRVDAALVVGKQSAPTPRNGRR